MRNFYFFMRDFFSGMGLKAQNFLEFHFVFLKKKPKPARPDPVIQHDAFRIQQAFQDRRQMKILLVLLPLPRARVDFLEKSRVFRHDNLY